MPPRTLAAAEELFDVEVRGSNARMSAGEIRAGFAVYDGMMVTLGDVITAEILADFGRPRCKMIANFGVGYNHIDVAAARAARVEVTNTPGAVTDATADIALTLMLMSARRAGEGERLVRSGQWEGWHPTQMLGLHLSGKVLGVVGMGRIGQAIARRAMHGFGMNVAYFTRSPKDLPDLPGAQPVADLHELMGMADVVVIAVPASPQTHHLIDAAALAAMQKHAHLINIARGDIVEEAALIAALQDGRIGGAGLDVYEFEPRVPEALLRLDNVTLLPHLGTHAEPFTILSTGTWTIAMTVGGHTDRLDPARDSLANVDAFGRPVPTARFMGGREFDMLSPNAAMPTAADVDAVIAGDVQALPSFMAGVGPFPNDVGYWTGDETALSPGERTAAVSLYLALVTQACLELCGLGRQIIIEGPLTRNQLFAAALGRLTGVPVLTSGDATGTSLGASMLFGGAAGPASDTTVIPLEHAGFDAYAKRWRARLA